MGEEEKPPPVKRARGRPRKPKADKDTKAAAATAKMDTVKDSAAAAKRRKTHARPAKTGDELPEVAPAEFVAVQVAKEDRAGRGSEPGVAATAGDELPVAVAAEFIEKPTIEKRWDDTVEVGECDVTFETGKVM